MPDPTRVRPFDFRLVPAPQLLRPASCLRPRRGKKNPATRATFAAGALGLAALVTGVASAESMIHLPRLEETPRVAATTFDPGGNAVGRSSITLEKLAKGLQKMTVQMGIDTGAQNVSEVTLAPTRSGAAGALQIVEERSQSTGGAAKARHVDLPDPDRVVNVPMQLLFQPLVTGEVDEVRFQIVLCTGGPRVQDMIAVRGPRLQREGREIIEIRYGPDFGETVAFFASRLLPSLSFWFDGKDGSYLGHRMPLHLKGPDIVLVRSGLTPQDLGVE
jgi:hypothetical protein